MFGDSPPPPRTPAPYPEGEVIHESNISYVVRHGDTVTKYAKSSDGMGAGDRPNEAEALRFVREHTSIPVPEVVSSDWNRITMEHVEGRTLREAWPSLEPAQRAGILAQLRDYMAQLRSLRGLYVGRLNGEGAIIHGLSAWSGGPFQTTAELHSWLVHKPSFVEARSAFWHQITARLGDEFPIVFTHGDISSENIIVRDGRDGRVAALLDWKWAGWAPEYWEYVYAMRGLDRVDWETLGSQVPSLFSSRHDMEYILLSFILLFH